MMLMEKMAMMEAMIILAGIVGMKVIFGTTIITLMFIIFEENISGQWFM